MRSNELKQNLQQYKAKAAMAKEAMASLKEELKDLEEKARVKSEAYNVLKAASMLTTESLKTYVEDIVNESLKLLFPEEAFKFELEFKEVRGKAAIEYKLTSNGEEVDLFSAGGGLLNWISLVLQLIVIHLSKSPLLVADEPLANLSEDKQAMAAKVLNGLREELGMKIIMVSHSRAFAEAIPKEGVVKL